MATCKLTRAAGELPLLRGWIVSAHKVHDVSHPFPIVAVQPLDTGSSSVVGANSMWPCHAMLRTLPDFSPHSKGALITGQKLTLDSTHLLCSVVQSCCVAAGRQANWMFAEGTQDVGKGMDVF